MLVFVLMRPAYFRRPTWACRPIGQWAPRQARQAGQVGQAGEAGQAGQARQAGQAGHAGHAGQARQEGLAALMGQASGPAPICQGQNSATPSERIQTRRASLGKHRSGTLLSVN